MNAFTFQPCRAPPPTTIKTVRLPSCTTARFSADRDICSRRRAPPRGRGAPGYNRTRPSGFHRRRPITCKLMPFGAFFLGNSFPFAMRSPDQASAYACNRRTFGSTTIPTRPIFGLPVQGRSPAPITATRRRNSPPSIIALRPPAAGHMPIPAMHSAVRVCRKQNQMVSKQPPSARTSGLFVCPLP